MEHFTAPNITLAFIVALAASTTLRFWLVQRQSHHIAAHRASVPAAFADRIELSAHQKAADYSQAKLNVSRVDLASGVIVLLALTLGGGLQWLSDFWTAYFSVDTLWHGVALILSVMFLTSLIDLPLTLYRTFVIEARFGFNRTTIGMFIADTLRSALVGLVLGVPLLVGVLWLMARMGEAWWWSVWLTWVGFNLLVLMIYPTFIAPLFNKFSPLQDPALAERINALLTRCGFRAQGLYVMDGSRRSSHGNAYFTGFGAAKRIVLFDTLLARLEPHEIEAVLAHELGHFHRHHVWKRIAMLFAGSLVLLWVLGQLMHAPGFFAGLNVQTQSTGMALLLFFMVLPVFTYFLQPLMSLYSRKHEFEADAYAATHTSGAALAHALVKLYQDNAATLTPDPLHSAFYDSHPPAGIRINRLQTLGQPS
jgi:STE24 endopeptidase